MRLIDADALHEEMVERMNRFHALGQDRVAQDYNFVATVIGNAPTADAVSVVRCRKCRHYTNFVCAHPGGMTFASNSDYCSLGRRRDQSAEVRNMGQSAGDGKTSGGGSD